MTGMHAKYLGSLRCDARHLKSGQQVFTDAPTDNKGRGEAFSPSDLMCTSLACCMMTIMGIAANEKGIRIGNIESDIEKIMASDPRRVIGINIRMTLEDLGLTAKEKAILENAALTCPVAKSLHTDIAQNVEFVYR